MQRFLEEANSNGRDRKGEINDRAFDVWNLQIDIWAPALCLTLLECPASRPNSNVIRVAAEVGPEGNPGSFTEILHPRARVPTDPCFVVCFVHEAQVSHMLQLSQSRALDNTCPLKC